MEGKRGRGRGTRLGGGGGGAGDGGGGEGGGGEGGGFDGGMWYTLATTCACFVITFACRRHSSYVPASRVTEMVPSGDTIPPKWSGTGGLVQRGPLE